MFDQFVNERRYSGTLAVAESDESSMASYPTAKHTGTQRDGLLSSLINTAKSIPHKFEAARSQKCALSSESSSFANMFKLRDMRC